MGHATLAPYLRPGHPRENASAGGIGSSYLYRGPTATIQANKPAIADLWADSRPVVASECFELTGASEISDLLVVTQTSFADGVIGTVLEQTFYELRWRPVMLPLEVHPKFRAGTYDLSAVTGSGESARTGYADVIGWRAELDSKLRGGFQYKRLDSAGQPAGSELTCGTAAQKFIQYLLKGVEEYVDYMPIWSKRSVYRGSSAPSSGGVGQKTSPAGGGYPSGYEWLKSADNVQRVGTSSRWHRAEEWEGAIKVFVDRDDLF